MPAHAAFHRSRYSRSDIFMRARSFHHAVARFVGVERLFLTTEARTAAGDASDELVG